MLMALFSRGGFARNTGFLRNFVLMSRMKVWIEAMRLRTLPVSVAGVLMATGYALADGTFRAAPSGLCLVFAVLCQIASNFANEYYDYRDGRDRAGRVGPRRGVTEGDITPHQMKMATFGTLAVAALVGLSLTWWGGLWLIAIGLIIGLGALAYSTGPYPLSTHCLGEVAVVFFFGIIPVCFTYYVQALAWSWPVFAGSVALGLMGANVLVINNYRDIPDDITVGKHTLATRFGRRAMVVLYLINAIIALNLTLLQWLGKSPAWLLVPFAYLAASIAIVVAMSRRSGRALTPLLGATSVAMFVYALGFILSNL